MSNRQPISTLRGIAAAVVNKTLPLVAGLAGTLFVSGPAHGELLGISLVAKEDPDNPQLLICNLLVNFDTATDKLRSALGLIPGQGHPQLFFSTNSQNGFHQEQFFGGDKDFAITAAELGVVPAMANDTYFNVGIKSGETTTGGVASGTPDDFSSGTPFGVIIGWNAGGKLVISDPITGGGFDLTDFNPPDTDQNIAGNSPNGNSIFLAQLVIDRTLPTHDGMAPRIDVQIATMIWRDAAGNNFLAGFNPFTGQGQAFTASHISAPLLTCPWDLNDDSVVNVLDLIELVMSLGPCEDCPADFDDDGFVNVLDLITLIMNFGPCPGTPCVWDVNGDGIVDQADLDQIVQNMGPCDGCPQDINGDGVVNGQDAAAVATHFGPCP